MPGYIVEVIKKYNRKMILTKEFIIYSDVKMGELQNKCAGCFDNLPKHCLAVIRFQKLLAAIFKNPS